jgi:hypothetical protein
LQAYSAYEVGKGDLLRVLNLGRREAPHDTQHLNNGDGCRHFIIKAKTIAYIGAERRWREKDQTSTSSSAWNSFARASTVRVLLSSLASSYWLLLVLLLLLLLLLLMLTLLLHNLSADLILSRLLACGSIHWDQGCGSRQAVKKCEGYK